MDLGTPPIATGRVGQRTNVAACRHQHALNGNAVLRQLCPVQGSGRTWCAAPVSCRFLRIHACRACRAHRSALDCIGVQMFEFTNNEKPQEFKSWKTATFRFCVQDPDIEALVGQIFAKGGEIAIALLKVPSASRRA